MKPKAVVLLSGGVDSTTTLAIARQSGFETYAISFRYGQRHQAELEAARKVAAFFKVKQHLILDVDLSQISGSALIQQSGISPPKNRPENEIGSDIPSTYVPARNIIFLSIALGWAEVLGARAIFIGANVVDYSGYPDCRPEFIEAFQTAANLGTKAGAQGFRFKIHAPLSKMSKAQIIKKGVELGVDFSMTLSCYDPSPDGKPCGSCDSCILRKKGFAEAGVQDW
ncbi:MAG TPA: 7-cyano-7-deazaguanine synthase QueC [bacterium]|mgnify:CR=1 FL=1|nr:7-cyano-7-deazaguanine synthase QueC [bacterium]